MSPSAYDEKGNTMRAIIVEDEPLMIEAFLRMSKGVEDLNIVGTFESAEEAINFSEKNPFEIAFLDIELPGENGIECAKILREKMPELLVVFISAYDDYLREFNQIGGDDYIIKPYKREIIEKTMEKMRLLVQRQKKGVYVQMFGRFNVMKDGAPVPLRGKAKEILAYILVKRGKEVSNEEIYSAIWESREYSNVHMKVYYNALRRLKDSLQKYELQDIIFSTARGQMANTDIYDCDYYAWQDDNAGKNERFEGEFMTEYSWGEYILGNMVSEKLY